MVIKHKNNRDVAYVVHKVQETEHFYIVNGMWINITTQEAFIIDISAVIQIQKNHLDGWQKALNCDNYKQAKYSIYDRLSKEELLERS